MNAKSKRGGSQREREKNMERDREGRLCKREISSAVAAGRRDRREKLRQEWKGRKQKKARGQKLAAT